MSNRSPFENCNCRNPACEIRRWMVLHKEEFRDNRTGEINLTELVEDWDRTCADGEATLDPDHIAWDVAATLESK